MTDNVKECIADTKKELKTLACVVVYDRIDIVCKWLRAWNNAEKYGTPIVVIHNQENPTAEDVEKILSYKPDFYIKGDNKLWDIGAFKDVVEDKLDVPEWDVLCWFTDDMLPMRRKFLRPFIEKFDDKKVGLVAQCYEPKAIGEKGGHIRTVAFAVSREFAKQLEFPDTNLPGRNFGYEFEHGKMSVLKQCLELGYEFKLTYGIKPDSKNYLHWTSFLDWMWDCETFKAWTDYWDIYEEQFSPIQRRDDLKSHPEMLLSIEECERLTTIPDKVTAIIATCQAPLEYLTWSILSLLERSTPDVLEHIIVVINGPDKRTGDPSLQDRKQAFLEDLRNLKWQGKDMPLTVVRTWSRVGHSQSLEQAIPWVHTQNYLVMHDDVIVLSPKWQNEAKCFFQEKDVAIKTWGQPLYKAITFSHLNSVFTLCKKPILEELGVSWNGYHIPIEYHIGNFTNYEKFIAHHTKYETLHELYFKDKTDIHNHIGTDIGAWLYYKLKCANYQVNEFSKDLIFHFGGASWGSNSPVELRPQPVLDLEKEILTNQDFAEVYRKYVFNR